MMEGVLCRIAALLVGDKPDPGGDLANLGEAIRAQEQEAAKVAQMVRRLQHAEEVERLLKRILNDDDSGVAE